MYIAAENAASRIQTLITTCVNIFTTNKSTISLLAGRFFSLLGLIKCDKNRHTVAGGIVEEILFSRLFQSHRQGP